jgi:hypothetical protein
VESSGSQGEYAWPEGPRKRTSPDLKACGLDALKAYSLTLSIKWKAVKAPTKVIQSSMLGD